MNEYERLVRWYKRVTWFGIFLNMLFVVPLVFAPRTDFEAACARPRPGVVGAQRWHAAVHHQRLLFPAVST